MRRKWKVTAELNMDASRVESITVTTNLEAKARKLAEEHFKKKGAFCVSVQSCTLI